MFTCNQSDLTRGLGVNVSSVTALPNGITKPLARMEVWIDGVKKYTETTSPTLSFTITLGPGSHRFAVFADDTTGGKTETVAYATIQ